MFIGKSTKRCKEIFPPQKSEAGKCILGANQRSQNPKSPPQ